METGPRLPSVAEKPATLFVALELSKSTWLVAIHSPAADKISQHRLAGGDTTALLSLSLVRSAENRRPYPPFPASAIMRGPSPPRTRFGRIAMNEDRFNIALRKFLKVVGITSQREIERVVREGKVEGAELKLRMTLTAENAPLNHIVEETIDLR